MFKDLQHPTLPTPIKNKIKTKIKKSHTLPLIPSPYSGFKILLLCRSTTEWRHIFPFFRTLLKRRTLSRFSSLARTSMNTYFLLLFFLFISLFPSFFLLLLFPFSCLKDIVRFFSLFWSLIQCHCFEGFEWNERKREIRVCIFFPFSELCVCFFHIERGVFL